MLRLTLDVDQIRYAHLHAEGQLVLGYPRGDHRIIETLSLPAIELAECIEHAPALGPRNTGRVVEIENGITLATELHPLETPGEKARPPEAVIKRLACFRPAVGGESHEGGKICVLAPEPVGHPGPHARAPRIDRAGLEEGGGRVVIDRLGIHALYHADLIDHLRHVPQGLAQPDPGLPMAGKLEGARSNWKGLLARGHRCLARIGVHRFRNLLAELARQLRLVVEEIHLRRPA